MAGSSPSERVAALAESFVERYRRGERPAVADYAARFPDLAGEIREVFPAVALMENIALDHDPPAPRPVSPAVAQVGDFRIVREVGRGGMGVVYEAEQLSLGRYVALKLLPGHTAATDRQKERFLREARAAAKLHHTNIVPVFGFGEADGVPYYAMQFIRGQGLDAVVAELRARAAGAAASGTLAADLSRSLAADTFAPPAADATRPVPRGSSGGVALSGDGARAGRAALWQGVARVGAQVANALDHAHGLGVVHRDVKPSNLLLDVHGTAWVTDFGLAKAEGQPDLTRDGDVLGTLRYLPPEALDGKADARGDVFALGLCLYELLALRPAYDAADRGGLVRQVTAADPPPLRALVPGLPRDLATVVHKALQREPDRRYRTAAALAADLGRWLDGRPIAARPVSAAGHAWRACRRNPWASGMAALAALALVVGTAAALWSRAAAVTSAKDATDQRTRAETNEAAAVAAAGELRRERDEVRRLHAEAADRLYVADMGRAQLNWYGGNAGLVRALLAAHRPAPGTPDRRGIEWFYLDRMANAAGRALPAESPRPAGVVFDPRGGRVMAAGGGVVEAWDAKAGARLWAHRPLQAAPDQLHAAFDPDGERVVLTENDGGVCVLRVLDARTGASLTTAPVPAEVRAVAFLPPPADALVAGCGDGVRVLDAATLAVREHLPFYRARVNGLAVTPNGRLVAAAGAVGGVTVWDTTARPWAVVRTCSERSGPKAEALGVALADDGRQLVTVTATEVQGWDVARPLQSPTWRRAVGARAAAFDRRPRYVLVACRDGLVRVLDAEDAGVEVGALRGHEGAVEGVAVSPARVAASAGRDGAVRVWDLAAATGAREVRPPTGPAHAAALGPGGAPLVTGGAAVEAWDAATGRALGRVGRAGAHRVRFSPDGTWLAVAGRDGSVACWAAADLTRAGAAPAWEAARAHPGQRGATDLDFSADGARLVSCGGNTMARVFDVVTGKEAPALRVPSRVLGSVCVHPDGTTVAVACEAYGRDAVPAVAVYDPRTGAERFVLVDPAAALGAPRFGPDGARLYAAAGPTVRAWAADTGAPLQVAFRGHTGPVRSLAVSADGRRLLTASDDGTARLWDAATGHELLAFRGHVGAVREATFAAAGDAVVTAGDDGTVRVWDAPRR